MYSALATLRFVEESVVANDPNSGTFVWRLLTSTASSIIQLADGNMEVPDALARLANTVGTEGASAGVI